MTTIDALKPLNDLVVIRRIKEEEPKTAMGILLPPTEESNLTPYRGVVVAVGPGKPTKLSGAGSEVVASLKALVDAFHMANAPRVDGKPQIPATGGIDLAYWHRAVDALSGHEPFPRRTLVTVKVGDTVVFSRNGFQEMKYEGETLIVMGEASIIGILE